MSKDKKIALTVLLVFGIFITIVLDYLIFIWLSHIKVAGIPTFIYIIFMVVMIDEVWEK